MERWANLKKKILQIIRYGCNTTTEILKKKEKVTYDLSMIV
jgi:hypothetical protein